MARLPKASRLQPPKRPPEAGLGGWASAAGKAIRDQLRAEWAGSPPHRWLIARPKTQGRAAAPVDLRPPDPRRGQAILTGRFVFDGLVLEPGPGVSPWDKPSPSSAFAAALHGMAWLPDLLATDQGPRTALSLVLGWRDVFGHWNGFSWNAPVLERRVFNLACSLKTLCAEAGEADAARLTDSLARQARHLLLGDGEPVRAAEQACAAAVAGCCLSGKAGKQLRARALRKLRRALAVTVLADGGHASRSPEAALELLLDLRTLDRALSQLGVAAPAAVVRAMGGLSAAIRALTLPDGRLPSMQGGEAGDPARVAVAITSEDGPVDLSLPQTGYEVLAGRSLRAIVDVAAPAAGPWSQTACAQPLALEVVAGADRLIVNAGWSPRAAGAQALRLTPAASTANVSDTSAGYPMQGALGRIFGSRLHGGAETFYSRRQESDEGVWLEASHDGWAPAFGLIHDRRLYMNPIADELRGEDALAPAEPPYARRSPRPVILVVRFHLHPAVQVALAMDHKSVLLTAPSEGRWWLRSDAAEVRIEPAVHLVQGRPEATYQAAMRTPIRPDGTARIRWKLSPAQD
jgi:uncharacterized heparinase superfamily protein